MGYKYLVSSLMWQIGILLAVAGAFYVLLAAILGWMVASPDLTWWEIMIDPGLIFLGVGAALMFLAGKAEKAGRRYAEEEKL